VQHGVFSPPDFSKWSLENIPEHVLRPLIADTLMVVAGHVVFLRSVTDPVK
jgi:hypothetical protein